VNIEKVPASVQLELWIVPITGNLVLATGPVALHNSETANECTLFQNGSLTQAHLRDDHQQNNLDFHLKRGCARLSHIQQIATDGSALLKVSFFNGPAIEMGKIEIGIDDQIESTAKRSGFRFQNTQELAEMLRERCQILMGDSEDESYFLMNTGAATDLDFSLEGNTKHSPNQIVQPEPPQLEMRCFTVCGDGLRIPVEKKKTVGNEEILAATKLISRRNNPSDGALRLAKGRITFADYTRTGRIRALAAGSLSRLVQNKGSFFKKWDEYGAVEGKLLLARAQAVGKLAYRSAEATGKGVRFFFDNPLPEGIAEGDVLEIASDEPPYLRIPELTWEEYCSQLEEEWTRKNAGSERKSPEEQEEVNAATFAKIMNLGPKSLELDLIAIPAPGKFLVFSINGDTVQVERRMQARRLILEGRSANPMLGLLIEEGGEIPQARRASTIKPLTHHVQNKIFKHAPTPAQVKAIDIALNTPDIALIQGPPGTGKTTVITAILERLNEEHDKTRSVRGEILVSGFQHDAVENIISRLSINALPAVKFGRRSGESKDSEDVSGEKIAIWCGDVANKLRLKNPQIIKTEEQRKLSDLFVLYSVAPSTANAKNLLNLILELPRNLLPQELTERANDFLAGLIADEKPLGRFGIDSLRLIRSLRISENGFRDDGSDRAADIMDAFDAVLTVSEQNVLKRAILWKEGKELDFLDQLKAVKRKLLEMYTPAPLYKLEKPRADILSLIAQTSLQLDARKTGNNKSLGIIADFLHELEDNPDGVRKAIEDYNYVFAATTQQAVGKPIRKAKATAKGQMIKFDTIIVDEAARTSPRDLLIPMAQAEKRIILVGDHRQLPHLINEEVAKLLETGEGVDIKQSMFEYLFDRLKKLSELDGIPRTVTLDAQYRMHPSLGKFISDNFYQKDGGFGSPLSPKHFAHQLAGCEGLASVWLSVPHHEGKEDHKGTSRFRDAEVAAISRKLVEWINSPSGKNLSFGIISFYKAQVDAMGRELSDYGITKTYPDGSWEITKEYRFLPRGDSSQAHVEERLRIGTVDSFQGMEFDVVFLSMVRSQDLDRLPPNIRQEMDENKKAGKLFGHLLSPNRLCVSMSRQKKLLVVVGNSELASSSIARESVPALGNFLDLCMREGAIL